MSGPLSLTAAVGDDVLFEDAQNAQVKFYLPRYRLAEQTVSGRAQFRARLEQGAHGGTLTIFLEKFPAPSLAAAARDAAQIAHRIAVTLKTRVPVGTSQIQQHLAFQEITFEGPLVKAVLRLDGLAQVTQVFQVLTARVSSRRRRKNSRRCSCSRSWCFAIGVAREVFHIDVDRLLFLELLEPDLHAGLYEVDVGGEARAEVLVDALHVGPDRHLHRRLDPGELERIEDADRRAFFLERVAKDHRPFMAQAKTEGSGVRAVQRGGLRPQNRLHRS